MFVSLSQENQFQRCLRPEIEPLISLCHGNETSQKLTLHLCLLSFNIMVNSPFFKILGKNNDIEDMTHTDFRILSW